MVSDAVLTKQLKRLLRLPFAPSEPEEAKGHLDEWRRILRPRCSNDVHCAAVVDWLMDHSQRIPTPEQVIEATVEVPAPEVAKAPMGCETCNGTGFRSYQRKVAEGYVADIADFCTCPKGSWMRSAEQQRDTERAAKAKR